MVMHARKIPRLNDGYYDRSPAHPLEEKYPSKSHGSVYTDRYSGERKRPSPSGRTLDDHRPSPRSQAKSSRMERGSTDSPNDRRLNHSSDKAASISKDHKAEIQRSALRVCADWSEHFSSSGKKYYYNCRSEVSQWDKPKEWIDNATKIVNNEPNRTRDKNGRERSHTISNSSAAASKYDERQRHSSSSSSGNGQRMPAHRISSSLTAQAASSHGEHRQYSSRLHSGEQDSSSVSHNVHSSKRHWAASTSSSHPESANSGGTVPPVSRSSDPHRLSAGPHLNHESISDRYQRAGRGSHVDYEQSRTHNSRETHASHHAGHSYRSTSNSLPNGSRVPESHQRLDDTRHSDDMDISPDHTPASLSRLSSRQSSCGGTPHASSSSASCVTSSGGVTSGSGMSSSVLGTVAALSRLHGVHDNTVDHHQHQGHRPPQQNTDNNDLTQQAIQTLQKLQQALLGQQLHQQHAQNNQAHPNNHATGGGKHPEGNHISNSFDELGGTPSPKSDEGCVLPNVGHLSSQTAANQRLPTGDGECSPHPNKASPSLSQNSGSALGGSVLSGAARKTDGQMAPSLSQYYKEDLVKHLPSCSAGSVERQLEQACMMSEEAHVIGSMHCGQVSMHLKKARSLVRIAEIQSTVQEQRVLFLRQQIKDLESMKSQAPFMPYYSGT